MDNPHELALEQRLGYVGIGWQLNNIPSHYSHLERYERLEAARLKALRPGVRVGVLRNTEVATVFWDSAKAVMFNASTRDFWTQCDGKPCAGSWASPAGNTVKYWFDFRNPRLRDWWVYEYVGQALNESLFDGVYFDCSCGAPPGVPAGEARQFQRYTQLAFDRAAAMASAAGKWVSAWNSDGRLTQAQCAATLDRWVAVGANGSLSLQALAPDFARPGACGGGGAPCAVTAGHDAISDGIVEPPIATNDSAACCARCRANPRCDGFVLGRCDSGDPGCRGQPGQPRPGAEACFLVGGYRGLRPSPSRRAGCMARSPTSTIAGNNTIAAFLIARGRSAMLELPVHGAYEDMAAYGWNPLLAADFGEPVEAARRVAPGVWERRWTRATVRIDCGAWSSAFIVH